MLTLFSLTCSSNLSPEPSGQIENNEGLERLPNDKVVDTTQTTILGNFSQDGFCENVILELTSEKYGMVRQQGKTLDFRLTKSGDAEYDSIDNSGRIVRKTAVLTEAQFTHIRSLLNTVSKIPVQSSEYVEDIGCVDATFRKRIVFCTQNMGGLSEIKVMECRPIGVEKGDPVPPKVNELIEYIASLIR
jgi:hypothetical protein